jgi:hypothetical protein
MFEKKERLKKIFLISMPNKHLKPEQRAAQKLREL